METERTFIIKGYVAVKAKTHNEALFKAILTIPKFNTTSEVKD